MSPVTPSDAQGSSTRPYLIRALHDWCTDNGFTPYLAVYVDRGVQVPMEYVKNNEIVLNVGFEATSGLKLGNDYIEFKARFGGVAREIVVPVDHVVAIYARENGQGMAFPMPVSAPAADEGGDAQAGDDPAERAPRGLRLAGTEASGSTPARPAPLASVPVPEPEPAAPGAATAPDASDDTPPPAAPGGGRPALKRIK
ncbi:ClpXP protease specificity-enhancing factor [Ideonella azotifigens]|uniref:ClpXP protease specificity-enhancing factor n=2 Tax=Ideonella azotifigens TaxID=513160 RepID=A0ABN1KMC2_9BURK|nr:ClpXP protease specificity-enhancing factor [Ideonella azotifigens]MCD2343469.1 ClpXP protease specificity-enhancing factor [Ideonella azotifigens]